MKSKLLYLIAILSVLVACQEEDFYPKGLYGYQVEYMLSGPEKKHWLITEQKIDGERQEINDCQDSVWWVFDVVASDSTSVYELHFDSQCELYDTLVLGQLMASGGDTYFQDTVYLEKPRSTRYVMVRDITSSSLKLNYRQGSKAYEVVLKPTPAKLLSKQILPLLLAGEDRKDWRLSRLTYNGVNQTLADTSYLRVFRKPDGKVGFVPYVDPKPGIIPDFPYYGDFESVVTDDGYFHDAVLLSNGVVDTLYFDYLTSQGFQISRDTVTSTYVR